MHLSRVPVAPLALLSLLIGCGGGDLVLPNEGQPASVDMFSGNQQTATILAPAADSLVVVVKDRFGNPVPDMEVVWAAEGGGEVSPASTVTGNNGRAAAQRVLGAQPGSYGTTAVATALPEDVVSFSTTAVAARLVLVTQPGATASSGAVIDPQPVLQLQDPAGSALPRAGVSVTVQIASGEGSLRGGTTQLSDATGAVTFSDLSIVGSPGARTLIFAASGYAPATSSPVSLGVGAPAAVAIAGGNDQTAAVGTAVSAPPAVVVRDAGGTPVAGVAVAFAVASGGGAVTGGSATTGADGVATAGSWTLGETLGANTLTATVQADRVSGNPVTFSATATPGPASSGRSTVAAAPATIAASGGSSGSGITVIVRDSRGNPLTGQTVSLSATGPGVSLTQPGPTDASGTTTGRFSATGSGPHVVSATTSGVDLGSATVQVTPGAIVASQTVVEVPNGVAGETTVIQIRLKDQFGNPVGGGAGQISVGITGPNSARSVAVEDQGGGTYTARYTPTSVGIDQIEVRVAGEVVPGGPFGTTVLAGPADPDRTTASVPEGSFADPLEIFVFLADAQGNRLGQDGDQVQMDVEGVGQIPVEYVGDGTYRGRWTPFVVGTFKLNVRLNGTPIAQSPFNLRVRFFN
ncbi:MAG TPA: Ig-like domain-containing protein [Gemmatimonadales bacterium]|nr:Ig-like domain-containing protein [Gemmatimonadales bacterium]